MGSANGFDRHLPSPQTMKLLVTGGAGYIGSIVTGQLLGAGPGLTAIQSRSLIAPSAACSTSSGVCPASIVRILSGSAAASSA